MCSKERGFGRGCCTYIKHAPTSVSLLLPRSTVLHNWGVGFIIRSLCTLDMLVDEPPRISFLSLGTSLPGARFLHASLQQTGYQATLCVYA